MNRENRQGASAARKADEARLYALRGGVTRCCEAKAQSDGTDAVATKLSLVDRSRRRALLILSQTRFLEVTFCQNQSLAVYALFVIVIPFEGGKPQDSEKPVLVCADLLPYRHGLIHIAMCRWELSAASRRQKEAKNQFWSVQTYYLTVKTQSTLLFTAP